MAWPHAIKLSQEHNLAIIAEMKVITLYFEPLLKCYNGQEGQIVQEFNPDSMKAIGRRVICGLNLCVHPFTLSLTFTDLSFNITIVQNQHGKQPIWSQID